MRPLVCRLVAFVAARAGAGGAGAKLRQLSTDLVRAEAPSDVVGGRRVAVKLPGRVGRDQIATALRDGGWFGFEPPMPSVFAACAATYPGVVYDVGANTGFYTALAAAANKANTVHAFEPFPPVLADLRSTLRVNRCGGRVHVEASAVGSALGDATLYIPLQDHGLVETSATLSPDFKDSYSASIPVQVMTLDSYDDERQPGRVTLVKIDVESLEIEVLRGATRLLATHRPLVFCEVLPSGDAAGIEQLRREARYTDIRLHRAQAIVGDVVGFDPDGWNHLLVPDEKVDAIVPLLRSCDLAVEERSATKP